MKKLFGTDGIRAVASQPPLDAPTVYAIGLALAHTLAATTRTPRILLGMDTRESSEWIGGILTAGLTDGMIVRTYRRLFDPEFGSLRDLS